MQIADGVLKEFIAEFNEMLERMGLGLSSPDSHRDPVELVRSIYRDIHTIKGNAMMFGLPLTGRLTHAIENLLDLLRQKKTPLSPELVTQLLGGLDYLQQISLSLSQHKHEPQIESAINQSVASFEAFYLRLNASETAVPTGASEPQPNIAAAVAAPASSPSAEAVQPNIERVAAKSNAEEGIQETIRVNVQVLDNIMNMVGELVLVKNQMQQRVKNLHEEDVQISQRLSVITSELQTEVMKTRMQPVGNVLNKFHRICRDLASELKKDISLEILGAETELDRALLEAIRDPLMHIVRNSIDHGIETPEERRRHQKPGQGKVSISAFHEGGQVIIQISDNGKGIDVERVRKKALEKGLITGDKPLTEKNILDLVFHPGFSTAEKISNVSGRGVGMDVVKTNIEKIGGTVELESKAGQGTVTTLRIPLTLAIIPALIIACQNQAFAIPQGRIVELIQIDPSTSEMHLESIEGSPFIRLRGLLIPIIPLQDLFSKTKPFSGGSRPVQTSNEYGILSIVILSSEGSTFGAIVDDIYDSTDIVVKPLGSGLDAVKLFSGATILGDGSIALTIDVTGIAEQANIKNRAKGQTEQKISAETMRLRDSTDYLVVELSEAGQYALPLSTVHRLEKIAIRDIQMSGEFKVCLYRDAILPIFSLSKILGYKEERDDVDASVIVLSRKGRLYGLRVAGILDIMTSDAEIDPTVSQRREICGGFIQNTEVYTIIDPFAVLDNCHPGADGGIAAPDDPAAEQARKVQRKKRRILLAEDSRFFRNQITHFLQDSGYTVVAAEDGLKAFNILKSSEGKSFDLLLSDIEMPNMTGLELAEAVRAEPGAKTLPMLAITSRYAANDIARGAKAGFDQYLEKLNRDELIKHIDASLGVVA